MADEKKVQRWNPVLLANEKATVVTVSGELPFYAGMVDLEDGEWVRHADHAAREAELLEQLRASESARVINWNLLGQAGEERVQLLKEIAILRLMAKGADEQLGGQVDFRSTAEEQYAIGERA